MEDSALKAAIEQAEGFKVEGNAAFKAGDNAKAILLYTNAIELDPENAVYYSNRSAAYLKQGESRGKALKDAEKCIELRPDWVKGYIRKGAAEHALTRFDTARSTYYKGLDLDPDNETLKSAIEDARKAGEAHSRRLREENQLREKKKREMEEHRQEIQKKFQEKQAKEEAEIKEDSMTEDALLNSFFSEVKDIEDQQNCVQKPADDEKLKIERPPVDFGTAESQVARILQPHYKWINLNPFHVLQLEVDATKEEIKKHYWKISSLIHPDKCRLENAREAFEEVKKAHEIMLEDNRRKTCVRTIESARARAAKERKRKLKKGIPEAQVGTLEEVQRKEVMKTFAEMEERRRNLELREGKQRQREQAAEHNEQQKMVDDYKREREWAQGDRREKRVGSWRHYQKDGKKPKVVSMWKEEQRVEGKEPPENESYKKKWR